MTPTATGKVARPAQPVSHGAHAHDHHRPGAGFGHAANTETRDITEEDRSSWRYLDLAPATVRAGKVGEPRQVPIELQRFVVHQTFAPGFGERNPFRLGHDSRLGEFARHLQDWRIVVAARFQGLVPDPCTQCRLDRRRDGRRNAPLAVEGEKAALVARKDRDQQTGEQKYKQDRVLLAALCVNPVSRPTGSSHLVPHPPSEESLSP